MTAYNFGNNYGSLRYILDYLTLRKCTQITFLVKYDLKRTFSKMLYPNTIIHWIIAFV